jgi:hypothetical protein
LTDLKNTTQNYLKELQKLSPIDFQLIELKRHTKDYFAKSRVFKIKKESWQALNQGQPILLTGSFRFRFEFLLKYLRKKRVDVTRTKLDEFLKEIVATQHQYHYGHQNLRFWSVDQETILFL